MSLSQTMVPTKSVSGLNVGSSESFKSSSRIVYLSKNSSSKSARHHISPLSSPRRRSPQDQQEYVSQREKKRRKESAEPSSPGQSLKREFGAWPTAEVTTDVSNRSSTTRHHRHSRPRQRTSRNNKKHSLVSKRTSSRRSLGKRSESSEYELEQHSKLNSKLDSSSLSKIDTELETEYNKETSSSGFNYVKSSHRRRRAKEKHLRNNNESSSHHKRYHNHRISPSLKKTSFTKRKTSAQSPFITRTFKGEDRAKKKHLLRFCATPPASFSEGPPSPLQLPTTLAMLRVILLVGFVSGTFLADMVNPPRLTFFTPIHSMVVTRILKEYYKVSRGFPSQLLLLFRSSLIASQLRSLGSTLADPIAGKVEPLLCIEELQNQDEVIVETFDFLRCDGLIRTALRRDHPSLSRLMWECTTPVTIPKILSKGVGLGAENVDSTYMNQQHSNIPPPANRSFLPSSLLPSSFRNKIPTTTAANPSASAPFGAFAQNTPGTTVTNDLSSSASQRPSLLLSFPSQYATAAQQQSLVTSKQTHFKHPTENLKAQAGTDVYRKPSEETTTISNSVEQQQQLTLEELLNAPSAKEQQLIDSGAELRDLLTAPTAKHFITTLTFQSRGGSKMQQICRHGTRQECLNVAIVEYQKRLHQGQTVYQLPPPTVCSKIHFRRILLAHTDSSLGDCSYLDTCRHMETCRFVHYEVDLETGTKEQQSELLERLGNALSTHTIGTVMSSYVEEAPAQWITCDIRKFDWAIFRGKIKIVMADPPWDIHMDLPYGTMTDTEMKSLRLDVVQDEGLLFLWVTGRAMELGRECMKLWGYKQIEELVWVKTNQLHRIIRTGRTGHWLNHSKEHCLVGIKGQPKLNRHVDTDVIVAEVRETSRKPDEIYRIIERLSPGPYKLELFGRQHNIRNNWITLGNQLDGKHLHDELLVQRYKASFHGQQQPLSSTTTNMLTYNSSSYDDAENA